MRGDCWKFHIQKNERFAISLVRQQLQPLRECISQWLCCSRPFSTTVTLQWAYVDEHTITAIFRRVSPHTHCTSHNNLVGLQPKMKLPCFQESKDASSLTFRNFFFFSFFRDRLCNSYPSFQSRFGCVHPHSNDLEIRFHLVLLED